MGKPKRNKGTRYPTRIVVFDTETTQDVGGESNEYIENKFRLGVASRIRIKDGLILTRSVLRYNQQATFWDWLRTTAEDKTQTYIFAHNLQFDLTIGGFWRELQCGRFRLSDVSTLSKPSNPNGASTKGWQGFICRDDPPFIVKVRDDKHRTYTFIDTLNYWKTSLATIGEQIGIPKLDMPPWEAPDDLWYAYCENDVEVLEKAILGYISWLRKNDLGSFKLTAPSQAYESFMHRFIPCELNRHKQPEVQKLEREGYYGGRLESFYIGTIKPDPSKHVPRDRGSTETPNTTETPTCYLLDVTSLYPSVMRQNLYPTELLEYSRIERPYSECSGLLDYRCIADVHLKTKDTYPRRYEGIGIIFPKGCYRTVLTGPELDRAIKNGAIRYVYSFARYTLRPIFTQFVDYFWGERLAAKQRDDKTGDNFAKLLMNSLYGKFGQLSPEWEELGPSKKGREWAIDHEIWWDEPGVQTIHNIGGVAYHKKTRTDGEKSFCAIASWVTAYARERMRDLINVAGPENVYYIVTDGLLVNRTGYRRLELSGELIPKTLGKLEVRSQSRIAHLGGIHWYQIGDIIKLGSNKSKAIVLSSGHAFQEQWERLPSILKRGPTDTIRIFPHNKFYKRDYRRGLVQDDGYVLPLELNEEIPESGSMPRNASSPPANNALTDDK